MFKVAILQKRSINEQIDKNIETIIMAMEEASEKHADILLLPECFITGYDLAYATYKPIVEEICARKASESEVEYLLDYMVGICSSDRMLELFKCVCRKYIYLYPEMVTSEIYTYKSMYEEAGNDLTGANFAHVDGNGENH